MLGPRELELCRQFGHGRQMTPILILRSEGHGGLRMKNGSRSITEERLGPGTSKLDRQVGHIDFEVRRSQSPYNEKWFPINY